jgi:hypothetical protein
MDTWGTPLVTLAQLEQLTFPKNGEILQDNEQVVERWSE